MELGTATGSCHVSSSRASRSVLHTVHVRYTPDEFTNERFRYRELDTLVT